METGESSSGYYCHKCDVTIPVPLSNLCPRCNEGFIEKLPSSSAAISSFSDQSNERNENSGSIPTVFNRVFNDYNNFEFIVRGGDPGSGHASDNRPSASSRRENTGDGSQPNDRRRPRNQNYAGSLEHVLSEFLNTVTRPTDSNSPVFFVSNPGDYAWGREGLDSIVTQLLNQMDSSGPPPLAKDKIKELPYVSVTEKQASENIQCSVCWDSFKICENVRQLPCEHIYHDICIVPWLELHGTCPICRKLLCEDGEARLGFTHSGGLEALLSDVRRQSLLQGSYASGSQRGPRGRHARIQCFRCRNFGHIARDCPQRRRPSNAVGSWEGDVADDDDSATPSATAFLLPSLFLDEPLIDSEEDLLDSEDFESDYGGSSGTDDVTCIMYDSDRLQSDVFTHWEQQPPPAVAFSGSSESAAGQSRKPRRPKPRCYNCGQLGHIARDCCASGSGCMYCSKTNHKSENCWYARLGGESKLSSRSRGPNARPGDARSSTTVNVPSRFSKKRGGGGGGSGSDPSTFGGGGSGGDRNRRSSGHAVPSTSRFQSPSHRGITCYYCDNVGHIARECPQRRANHSNRRGGAMDSRSCPHCGWMHYPDAQCEYNFI